MTLPVPLTISVGDRHVTEQAQSLSFRREAIGGVRSISFGLARPLSDLDGMDPLAKVRVYDARTAETVAEGRLSDTGRTAGPDGQRWECVAFGPAQAASDITRPKIYIDRSIGDGWVVTDVVHPGATVGIGSMPGAGEGGQGGVLANFPSGTDVVGDSRVVYRYDRLLQSTDRLALMGATWATGVPGTSWLTQMTGGTGGAIGADIASSSGASGTFTAHVGTAFTLGVNTPGLRFQWVGAATTTAGDDTWGWWESVVVVSIRQNREGVDIVTGYGDSVTAAAVVNDLLGSGFLPEFDGPNAAVPGTAVQIKQLAYANGVTAAQILDDLMQFEPTYRWYSTPDTTGNGYGFRWEEWPTTVRYEATLNDGGSFPLSTQSVYNRVMVRHVDEGGSSRTLLVTGACPVLDDQGIVRQAELDLGSEIGTTATAIQAGENFLAANNVPKNSGTLTVARPIRDVLTGAMVQPWEIEAGELVRIRGVEAYPDAFNATTNDGQGVFRIHAVDYTTEGNVATLALDSDPRETEDALVRLMKERTRR